MKKILFAFLLFAGQLAAQTDTTVVVFSLDTIRIDSFFLVHRDSHFSASTLRPAIHQTSTFFADTAAFSAYIAAVGTEYNALIAQAQALNRAKLEWNYRYERLKCLRDSVFYGASCSGVGARMVAAPPPEEQLFGFWVAYPSTAEVQYVYMIEDIKNDAVLLYPNGISATFKKPKAAPKKATPKKKKQ